MRKGLGVVLALFALAVGPTQPVAADPVQPTRILILGDSSAQGSAGDWTWRYRAWKALTDAGVEVDFVGPRDDLFDNVAFEFGSQDYADPQFDRDHAARWGTALAFPDVAMVDLMTEYRPDVVVETRGYNDLTWLEGQPGEVRSAMADEIAAARSVDPSVEFVLAQLPQLWKPKIGDFDAALPGFAAEQSQPGSRVVTAATGSGFVQGVDTWDLAHYSATGEVKFAAGVVDALADLGVGVDYPRPFPEVVNGHWGAAVLAGKAGDGTATLTWRRPPGAYGEYVWRRDVTTGEPWVRLPALVEGETWSAGGLVNSHQYAFRLQAAKGDATSVDYSNEIQLFPNLPAPSRPARLVVAAGAHRLTATWAAAPQATFYVVSWAGRTTGGSGSRAVQSRSLTVPGLLAGERYDVTVTPYNVTVPGPSARTSTLPTGPVAAQPRSLRTSRSTPGRVRLAWRPGAHATSYAVWQRSGSRWRLARTTTSTAVTLRTVPAGTVRFKVRSWHQLVPGRWSDQVRVRIGP